MNTLTEQLQVYRAAVLKVPTIEKINTPALIEQIASSGNWQIATWHLLGDYPLIAPADVGERW
jgi:hypothetical protein